MSKTVNVVKQIAKQLTATLAKDGQALTHGAALEIVARAFGERNWHTFLAAHKVVPAESKDWSPAQGPMSNTQYKLSDGNACPVCGCEHAMESSRFECDGDCAWREVTCSSCGTVWTENFALAGWEPIKRADGATTAEEIASIGFLHAVRLWLFASDEGDSSEDDDSLMVEDHLCDLVIERAHGKSGLNSAVSRADQETQLENTESRASDINNQGPLAQLQYLLGTSKSRDEFLDMLAERCEVSLKDLML